MCWISNLDICTDEPHAKRTAKSTDPVSILATIKEVKKLDLITYIKSRRRPRRSMRKNNQISVSTVLTTPKIPVVRKPVLVPVIPRDLKTVGE
jgi:hypothetical protein